MRDRIAAAVFALVCLASAAATATGEVHPAKQSNAGDSISQGFSATGWLGEHPDRSWVQGTDPGIGSIFGRSAASWPGYVQEPESVSGAEMVGGGDSFPAQASRICAQDAPPDRVYVLLGGNDVCNRARASGNDPAANLYSVGTWRNALRAGLDQLASCLPADTAVHVLSAPRVDALRQAGLDKSWFWCGRIVWPAAGICRVVTAEDEGWRRAAIGARIDAYNAVIGQEVAAYDAGTNGRNPNGVRFTTDWQGPISEGWANTSVGTYRFGAAEINGFDCFHPNLTGQRRLACVAWESGVDGNGEVSQCLP